MTSLPPSIFQSPEPKITQNNRGRFVVHSVQLSFSNSKQFWTFYKEKKQSSTVSAAGVTDGRIVPLSSDIGDFRIYSRVYMR